MNTGGCLGPALYQPPMDSVPGLSSRGTAHSLDDWRWAMGLLFAFALAGLASAFFVRETHCRNIYVSS